MRRGLAPWALTLIVALSFAAGGCGSGSSGDAAATDVALETAQSDQSTAFAATRTAFVPRPTNTPRPPTTPTAVSAASAVPASQPTPAGSPAPVTIVSVTGAPPNGNATVVARTSPATLCSISYVHPSGKLSVTKGLIDQVTGATGEVRWTFHIDSSTAPGIGRITVNCRGVIAQHDITIG